MNSKINWLLTCLLPYKKNQTIGCYQQNYERVKLLNSLDKRKKPQLNLYEKLSEIENFLIKEYISEQNINGKSQPEMVCGEVRDRVNEKNFVLKLLSL